MGKVNLQGSGSEAVHVCFTLQGNNVSVFEQFSILHWWKTENGKFEHELCYGEPSMVAASTAVISYTEKINPLFALSLNCQEAFQSIRHFNMQY